MACCRNRERPNATLYLTQQDGKPKMRLCRAARGFEEPPWTAHRSPRNARCVEPEAVPVVRHSNRSASCSDDSEAQNPYRDPDRDANGVVVQAVVCHGVVVEKILENVIVLERYRNVADIYRNQPVRLASSSRHCIEFGIGQFDRRY